MKEATEQEIDERYGSRDVSFNYRWEHVTTVVTLAKRLAKLTGADKDIVEAAAWLHDVRKSGQGNHALAGAEFARHYLPKTDFPDDKVDQVAYAIEVHMGLWRDEPLKNLEAMVLWSRQRSSTFDRMTPTRTSRLIPACTRAAPRGSTTPMRRWRAAWLTKGRGGYGRPLYKPQGGT